jgi:hypothetical protein
MTRSLIAVIALLLLSSGTDAAQLGQKFWVGGPEQDQYTEVRAVLVYNGRLARIWVDTRDTGRIGANVITRIARALDTATESGSRDPGRGIIENVQDVFGPSPSKYKVGGRDDFLLTDLKNPQRSLTMLGSFQTKDQISSRRARYSNERNILYIDSREGLRDMPRLLGTIAHEYQHLIQFGINPDGERFFNEACSELAAILVGYPHSNREFLENTNVPLLRWGPLNSSIESDYHRGMSLMLYMHEQFGDAFIREFVRADEKGVRRIEAAMQRAGHQNTDWQSVLKSFALASWLQNDGTGPYGFKQLLDPKRSVREASFAPGMARRSEHSVTLESYGASFHLYDRPGVMKVVVPQSNAFTASAIVYDQRGTHIVDLKTGRENIIGTTNDPPARVVLAFSSIAAEPEYVQWQVYSEGTDERTTGERDKPVITDHPKSCRCNRQGFVQNIDRWNSSAGSV